MGDDAGILRLSCTGTGYNKTVILVSPRFYVTFDRLRQAEEAVDGLLGGGEETEE